MAGDHPLTRRLGGLRLNAAIALNESSIDRAILVAVDGAPSMPRSMPPGVAVVGQEGDWSLVLLDSRILRRIARFREPNYFLWPEEGTRLTACSAEALDLEGGPGNDASIPVGEWLLLRALLWTGALPPQPHCRRVAANGPGGVLMTSSEQSQGVLHPRDLLDRTRQELYGPAPSVARYCRGVPHDKILRMEISKPALIAVDGTTTARAALLEELPLGGAKLWLSQLWQVAEALTQSQCHSSPALDARIGHPRGWRQILRGNTPANPVAGLPAHLSPRDWAAKARWFLIEPLDTTMEDLATLDELARNQAASESFVRSVPSPSPLPLFPTSGAEALRAQLAAAGRAPPLKVLLPLTLGAHGGTSLTFGSAVEGVLALWRHGLVSLEGTGALINPQQHGNCTDGVVLWVEGYNWGTGVDTLPTLHLGSCTPVIWDARDFADVSWRSVRGRWPAGEAPAWWPAVTGVRAWTRRALGAVLVDSQVTKSMVQHQVYGCGNNCTAPAFAEHMLLSMPEQPGSFVQPAPLTLDALTMLNALAPHGFPAESVTRLYRNSWGAAPETVERVGRYTERARLLVRELGSTANRPISIACPLRIVTAGGPRWWALRWVRRFAREQGLPICTTPEQCLQDGGVWVGEVSDGRYHATGYAKRAKYMELLLHSQVVVTSSPGSWDGDFRLFEAVAGGAAVMSDRLWNPLLAQTFVDGDSMVMYDTPNTATTDNSYEVFREKLLGLLKDGARRRRRLAVRAWEVAMRYHTPEERVAQLLAAAVAVDTAKRGQGR